MRSCSLLSVVALLAWPALGLAQGEVPPAQQNPSPMVELTRAHGRLEPLEGKKLTGTRRSFVGPLGKPVSVFLPAGMRRAHELRLVIHFHGASFVAEQAVAMLGGNHVAAVVNLAPGSGIYDRTFNDAAVYDSLLAGIKREVMAALDGPADFERITLVGFSAGHGAIRAILRDSAHYANTGAILLLDGLHTAYVPEGTVMAKGGTLDESKLEVFVRYARAAMRGEKRFLVTHSEIFPGTFASTTETTDHLIQALGLRRTPVLRWGSLGMQQLSEVRRGRFEIRGFAGNTGPDHIDQLHAMPELLRRLER